MSKLGKQVLMGSRLRIDGTDEYVVITKHYDCNTFIYQGNNKAGTITRYKGADGEWTTTSTHPLVFD